MRRVTPAESELTGRWAREQTVLPHFFFFFFLKLSVARNDKRLNNGRDGAERGPEKSGEKGPGLGRGRGENGE